MFRFFFSYHDGDDDNAAPKRVLPGYRLIPNMITIIALCAGLTSVYYGIDGRWTQAMSLIFVAAGLDTLDGFVARLLKASSHFGAELDSLSDFVSFGVAPATLLYLWNLHEAGVVGWLAVLLLSVAAALRLARFNTRTYQAEKNQNQGPPSVEQQVRKNFFEGVPAPAGAMLALLPMIIGLEYTEDGDIASILVGIWVLLIAALMLSRLPTMSLKKLKLNTSYSIPILGGVALFVAAFASEPALTVIILGVLYLISIPLSFRRFQRLMLLGEMAQIKDKSIEGEHPNPPPSFLS
jgi:CDP-diacylglycerol---serine O-phosphatidyltransferase